MVVVVCRCPWDFRITDEVAVLAAGRAAYLRAWSDDTQEDAEIRVQQVGDAGPPSWNTPTV